MTTANAASTVRMNLTVLACEKLTERIARILLGYADRRTLPAAEAGCHIEVTLQGHDNVPMHRAYSVVNPDTAPTHYEIAVQREDQGHGGSLQMHRLAVGTTVEVAHPKNDFGLCSTAQHHVLIAGGIGITPILAMAKTLARRGESFRMDYASRNRDDTAYADDVEALECGTCWFDGGEPGKGLDLQALLSQYKSGDHAYVCGPKGLITAVVEVAQKNGWPAEAVHYELFAGVLEHKGDRSFRVKVVGSEEFYEIPHDQTILDVLEAAGLPVMYDCRRGECGVCTAKVVSGVPDHRDVSLTAVERAGGKLICPCVSRCSSGELVLEL